MNKSVVKEAIDTYDQHFGGEATDVWPAVHAQLETQAIPQINARTGWQRVTARLTFRPLARHALAPARFNRLGWGLLIVSVLAVSIAVPVMLSMTSPKFAGHDTFVLVAHAEPSDTNQLAQTRRIIAERLKLLGVEGVQVQQVDPLHIQVEVNHTSPSEPLAEQISQTGRVEFIDTGDADLPRGQRVETTYCATGSLSHPQPNLCNSSASSPSHVGQPTYQTIITGDQVDPSTVHLARTSTQPESDEVNFTFQPDAVAAMRSYTKGHLGKYIAIVLDGRVVMSAVIQGEIEQKGQITGAEQQELRDLEMVLKTGSLPVPLTPEKP